MTGKTLASALLLGLSSAAIAQVAGAPIEQKTGNAATGNELAPSINTASAAPVDTDASPDNTADRGK